MAGARTFDHDEARRLKAEGLTHPQIAKQLGVSVGAIEWAVSPGLMDNWCIVNLRMPKDLRRTLEAQARAEGRSRNSQIVKILKDAVDWRYYEEDEEPEIIFAHPVARHIRRKVA